VLAADKYPGLFSRLALMEPMVIVDEPFQRMVTKRIDFDRTTWKSREEVFEYLSKHHSAGRWRADVIRDVAAHESYQREDGLFDMKWSSNSFNWPDRDGDYFDLKPIFDRLGIPILSISSTNHKSKFPNQHMVQDGVLGLHKLTIENSDHNMYMERPDAIAQAVADFAAGKEIPAAV